VDPVSESADTWIIVPPPGETKGVWDLRSSAGGEGSPYAQW